MARRRKMIEPHGSFRSPTDNNPRNGQVLNAPLYPDIGGARNVSRRPPHSPIPNVKSTGNL